MPNWPTLLLALIAFAALPVQADEVDPCEVDVGQCGVVGEVQDCVQGETDLCNTDDNVVQDCLQWELPACQVVWNEVQYCLEGPSPICHEVDACIDGEDGLCQRAIDEVGQCFPLGDGSDVCDDAWNAFMACQQPGGPCHLVAGVIIECSGNDYQPSPAPCEQVWAEIDACLASDPGLCGTATGTAIACVQSRDPCPVHHDEAVDCVVGLVREQGCDDL